MRGKTRWCDRTLSTGPFYCLVLNQGDFDKELRRMRRPFTSKKYVNEGCRAMVSFFTSKKDNPCCIVGLDTSGNLSGIEIAASLVHEAVHIWQYHCELVCEVKPGDEQEAYAIEHIARGLMESYLQQTKSNI
jgi:hypothetical protein